MRASSTRIFGLPPFCGYTYVTQPLSLRSKSQVDQSPGFLLWSGWCSSQFPNSSVSMHSCHTFGMTKCFGPQHRPWDVQRIGPVSKVDLTQDTMALLVLSQRFHCIKGHFDLRYHGFIGSKPTIPLRNWNGCSLLTPCSILIT